MNTQRWRFYPRINVRVTMPFLLITLLIAGVGIYIVTRLVSGSIEERLNRQLRDSADAATNTVVELERQQISTLRALAYTTDVPEAIATADLAALNKLLTPIAVNNDIDELLVYDINGQNIFRLSRPAEGDTSGEVKLLDTQTWPGIQRVITGLADHMGDKYVDIQTADKRLTFFVGAPVFTDDDILVGGISVGIYTTTFTRRVSEQALSEVVLFGPDGTVLGATFRNVTFEDLVLTPERASQLSETVRRGDSPIEEHPINNVPHQMLYGAFQMRSQPIGIIMVALSTDFVLDRISTSRDTFVLLFSSLLVGVVFLGWGVTRSIVRPVERLVKTTRAIQSGDLNQRVGLYTPDELGELGQSFDHMTGQLVKRNEEINDLYIAQVGETARRDAILTSISDVVIVLDLHSRPILMNDSATLLANTVMRIPQEFSLFTEICRHPQNVATPISVALAERHFSVLATPVRISDGSLLGHVVVFRDITEIIRAEKLKDELILQLSHELRTPLTAIQGYVDLVKLFNQNGNAQHGEMYVDKASEQLHILGRMMDQAVDVSAILANQFTIDTRAFDLQAMLEDVILRHRSAIENFRLQIYTMMPDLSVWVEGDELRLGQAFEQVLINAYHYTLPGGWIDVSVEQDDFEHVTIRVSDTGVGIAPDEVEKVFERMYRGQSADAGPTDQRGLGLGLYLARHVVELHHGTIAIESSTNLGTVVIFRLPVKQPNTVVVT